jgi:DNA-directed RNA polymerase specialized sigma24 family protein
MEPIPSSSGLPVPLYHQTPFAFTFVAIPDDTDSALWQDWLDQHGEVFLLFARQQTRCEADARDVFQEALIDAWRRSGSRPPDRALVFAQIRRRAIDLARSIDRRVRREQTTLREESLALVRQDGRWWEIVERRWRDEENPLNSASPLVVMHRAERREIVPVPVQFD